MTMETPVLLLCFNRPAHTQRVFEAIRAARPSTLLVAADGPRKNRAEDATRCAEVRAIIKQVDWACNVKVRFQAENLGCRTAVSSGISWAFNEVEECIILEDDTLPDQSFFPFCSDMLERFRNDSRVFHIGGNNFQAGRRVSDHSYYFSRYCHIWGWASWRRAWRFYDVDIPRWPVLRRGQELNWVFDDPREVAFWTGCFDDVLSGRCNTWDYQWSYACITQSALCVTPDRNLVRNIGFDEAGTHTKGSSPILINQAMTWPLSHPEMILRNAPADRYVSERYYLSPAPPGPLLRARTRLAKLRGRHKTA